MVPIVKQYGIIINTYDGLKEYAKHYVSNNDSDFSLFNI